MGGTLEFTEELAGQAELMPGISKMRLLRQWAGLCDMTPDYSPVMGPTPVDGFYVDVGWGTYGFKAGPVSGEQMAACVANGTTPELIKPFELSRFTEGTLVGEKALLRWGTDHVVGSLPYCGPMNAADLSYNGSRTADRPEDLHARGVAQLSVPAGEPVGLVARELVLQFWLPQAFKIERHTLTGELRAPVLPGRKPGATQET